MEVVVVEAGGGGVGLLGSAWICPASALVTVSLLFSLILSSPLFSCTVNKGIRMMVSIRPHVIKEVLHGVIKHEGKGGDHEKPYSGRPYPLQPS